MIWKNRPQGQRPAHILLVDDRSENLTVLEGVLGDMDCCLLKASSGNDALLQILKHDVALVLLDVQMPGMNGFETAELMRRKKHFQHIPIIFVTAINKDPVHVFKGYEAGAVDYVFKPFDPLILRSKVNVFIELYQQRKLLEAQTLDLEEKMQDLEKEISQRRHVEEELKSHRDHLEDLVAVSTAELTKTNTELRAEVERHTQTEAQLRKAMEGIIHAMTLTTEIRDPYTAGHQRRVSQLSLAIAKEMALTPKQLDAIRLAALVHDLGKIYVPAEILSKPGTLTDIEFSLIKSHPQVGYDILKSVEFPWPIAEIVLQHQERYDGSGYPHGLVHENILQEARVIGVADTIEAMAFHRPYRPALGLERAIQEVLSQKGRAFDPEVVEACLCLFQEKDFAFLDESEC